MLFDCLLSVGNNELIGLQAAGGDPYGCPWYVPGMAYQESECGRCVVVGDVCRLRDLVCLLLDFGSAAKAMSHKPYDGSDRIEG